MSFYAINLDVVCLFAVSSFSILAMLNLCLYLIYSINLNEYLFILVKRKVINVHFYFLDCVYGCNCTGSVFGEFNVRTNELSIGSVWFDFWCFSEMNPNQTNRFCLVWFWYFNRFAALFIFDVFPAIIFYLIYFLL
jgi:hypothetical protein